MPRSKLRKFKENNNFSNLIQSPDQHNWPEFFGNSHPIILELACGQGDYTLALAKMFPDKNLIGIDIKGVRIWRGAKTALEEKITNAAFLRTQIEDLENYFLITETKKSFPSSNEKGLGVVMKNAKKLNSSLQTNISHTANSIITDIWITFPDPFPKKRHIKKRLTSPRFLDMYKKILKPHGKLHLKTDDLNLLNYSVETASANGWHVKTIINNIYAQHNLDPLLQIQTFYEHRHLAAGKRIHYLCITP